MLSQHLTFHSVESIRNQRKAHLGCTQLHLKSIKPLINQRVEKKVFSSEKTPRSIISCARRTQEEGVSANYKVNEVPKSDVVIIGAGIIGIACALELLEEGLSVLVLEKGDKLCTGATGAGQGYLWMAHRDPPGRGASDSDASWRLACRGLEIWRERLASGTLPRDTAAAMEWQECGSVLLAQDSAEMEDLSRRAEALAAHGIKAELMDAGRLAREEPALRLPAGGGALRVATDGQINGRATTEALLALACRHKNFRHVMACDVVQVEVGQGGRGAVLSDSEGRRFQAAEAVVVAAGAWSGQFIDMMTAAAGSAGPAWAPLFKPRRGHLLELFPTEGIPFAKLRHGVMEMSYTKHYAAHHGTNTAGLQEEAHPESQSESESASDVDITFTATTSRSGSLLLGSSREFSGWSSAASAEISAAILLRAALFMPAIESALQQTRLCPPLRNTSTVLRGFRADSAMPGKETSSALVVDVDLSRQLGLNCRVGLRPFNSTLLPMVGPVPGLPGVFVAAGHEGSGLCMCPSTARLLAQHVVAGLGGRSPRIGVAAARDVPTLDEFRELLPETRLAVAAAGTH